VSRGPRRGAPGDRDCPQADTEAEAVATVTAIAGLRWRLRRPCTLEHPAVLSELHKLEEQVAAQLAEQDDRNPGRHRSAAATTHSRQHGQQIGDASGFDLKPDPLAATTAAEFITAVRRYKAWSGDPSWRKMAAQAGQTVVHSTMHAAMHGDALPKFDVVRAIITGCGGDETDLKAFATAWRSINSAKASDPAAGTGFLAAPVPALRLVPGG
jgi:hypothetical protein